ncbi:MAG: rRNA maturation RNase YbeY, partial [Candidatus Gallimonas sp.]
LELLVVDEEEIRSLNARTRAIDRVTDVLSFPSMELTAGEPVRSEGRDDELDEEGRLFLGSVVICEKRAREQAEEYGHSYERELNYLAVHGAMHCLGYDHETEEQKRAMRAKEEEILNQMNLGREE